MLSNLPRDLEEEVLIRIPMTSMRAVRFVSKTWNIISKGRSFTKKHLAQEVIAKERKFEGVMVIDHRVYLMSVNLHGVHKNIDPSINFKAKLVSLADSDLVDDIREVHHCDGLLLCIMLDTRFVVWNPYCGQTQWFEPQRYGGMIYAIGYRTSKSSYKVLRFAESGCRYLSYKIYNLNSKLSTDYSIFVDWVIRFHARGVSLKGNTYWFAQEMELDRQDSQIPRLLLCFDFTSERFGPPLSLPFRAFADDTVTLSSVRDEQLAVLFQREYNLEIWITTKIEPEAMSWSKFLAVDMEPLAPWEFECYAGSFFVDEDKKVVVVFDKDVDLDRDVEPGERYMAYIMGEDGYFKKVDLGPAPSCSYEPHICSYVPSLVQIE